MRNNPHTSKINSVTVFANGLNAPSDKLHRTKQKTAPDPTRRNYGAFGKAYDFFNQCLFEAELPRCIITMQRRRGTYGYFAPDRWQANGANALTA